MKLNNREFLLDFYFIFAKNVVTKVSMYNYVNCGGKPTVLVESYHVCIYVYSQRKFEVLNESGIQFTVDTSGEH